MIYIVMSFVCFAIAIMTDWILYSEDWTIVVKIAYYIIVLCGILFGSVGLIYITFH